MVSKRPRCCPSVTQSISIWPVVPHSTRVTTGYYCLSNKQAQGEAQDKTSRAKKLLGFFTAGA
jgi:hypothetical protein